MARVLLKTYWRLDDVIITPSAQTMGNQQMSSASRPELKDHPNSEHAAAIFPTNGIEVDTEPQELVSLLRDYGLGTVLSKALLCFSCNHLFLSSEAPSHWRNNHARNSLLCSGRNPSEVAEHLTETLITCTMLSTTREDFYRHLPPDRSPFKHVPLHDGWRCFGCNYVCLKRSSLEKKCQCTFSLRETELHHRQIVCQEIWFTNVTGSPKCIAVEPEGSNAKEDLSHSETLDLPWFSPALPGSDDGLIQEQRDITTFLRTLGFVDRTRDISTPLILSALKPFADDFLAQELRRRCSEYLYISQQQIRVATVKSSSLLKSLESVRTG